MAAKKRFNLLDIIRLVTSWGWGFITTGDIGWTVVKALIVIGFIALAGGFGVGTAPLWVAGAALAGFIAVGVLLTPAYVLNQYKNKKTMDERQEEALARRHDAEELEKSYIEQAGTKLYDKKLYENLPTDPQAKNEELLRRVLKQYLILNGLEVGKMDGDQLKSRITFLKGKPGGRLPDEIEMLNYLEEITGCKRTDTAFYAKVQEALARNGDEKFAHRICAVLGIEEKDPTLGDKLRSKYKTLSNKLEPIKRVISNVLWSVQRANTAMGDGVGFSLLTRVMILGSAAGTLTLAFSSIFGMVAVVSILGCLGIFAAGCFVVNRLINKSDEKKIAIATASTKESDLSISLLKKLELQGIAAEAAKVKNKTRANQGQPAEKGNENHKDDDNTATQKLEALEKAHKDGLVKTKLRHFLSFFPALAFALIVGFTLGIVVSLTFTFIPVAIMAVVAPAAAVAAGGFLLSSATALTLGGASIGVLGFAAAIFIGRRLHLDVGGYRKAAAEEIQKMESVHEQKIQLSLQAPGIDVAAELKQSKQALVAKLLRKNFSDKRDAERALQAIENEALPCHLRRKRDADGNVMVTDSEFWVRLQNFMEEDRNFKFDTTTSLRGKELVRQFQQAHFPNHTYDPSYSIPLHRRFRLYDFFADSGTLKHSFIMKYAMAIIAAPALFCPLAFAIVGTSATGGFGLVTAATVPWLLIPIFAIMATVFIVVCAKAAFDFAQHKRMNKLNDEGAKLALIKESQRVDAVEKAKGELVQGTTSSSTSAYPLVTTLASKKRELPVDRLPANIDNGLLTEVERPLVVATS